MSVEDQGVEQLPRMLGHYELQEKLGQGGMAVVYRAIQPSLNRDVAIKVLPERFANSPEMVARFNREANISAQLKHPSIVQIIDRGKEGETLYIVMECVTGESLDKMMARGRLPLPDVVQYAVQICEALQYAHDKGVVHRDLKPSNILISTETGRAKISDFGIAQLQTDVPGMSTMTVQNTSLGTMNYMSPEQRLDAHSVTHRTDIFSLGVMLYEMLTGKVPIGHFKLPSLIRADIPIGMDNIVSKCMAESPGERYQSAEDVRDDIIRLTGRYRKLNKPGSAAAGGGLAGVRKAIVTIFVLALLAAGGGALWIYKPWEMIGGPKDGPRRRPVTTARTSTPTRSVQVPSNGDPTASGVDASKLLAAARADFDIGDMDSAGAKAQRVRNEFPDSREAVDAQGLIDQIATLKEQKELAAVLQKAQAMVASPTAVEKDYAGALAALSEAVTLFPAQETQLAQWRDDMQKRWDKAHSDALGRGDAALAGGRWEEADSAFLRAQQLRADPEIGPRLAAVKRGRELAGFAAATDAKERAAHLALLLAQGRTQAEQQLLPEAKRLRGLVAELDEAKAQAGLFRAQMDTAARHSLDNAETDLAQANQKMAKLDPTRLSQEDLSAVVAQYQLSLENFNKASADTLERLYPGLASRSPAERVTAACRARGDYPGAAIAAEAFAKAVPDERLAAVSQALAAAEGTTSAEAQAQALAGVARECDRLAEAGADPTTVQSLKAFSLARRASALIRADRPVDALNDSVQAAALEADCPAVQQALTASADAVAGQLAAAGQNVAEVAALVRLAGPALRNPQAKPARDRLAAATEDGSFVQMLMREPPLARTWMDTVGSFTPAGMVRVPAGKFPLGIDYTGLKTLTPSSAPQHVVDIGEFHMDTREVTNGEFATFVRAGGYEADEYWTEGQSDRTQFVDTTGRPGPKSWKDGACPEGAQDLPVTGVSWYEAAAYAAWAGKRLPTEAEWECGATGVPPKSGNTYQKQPFPWGGSYLKGKANLSDTEIGRPSKVGSWPEDKSPLGCLDVLGNVREWTISPYVAYPNSDCEDKAFGTGGVVVRGRCFADSQIGAELTARRAMGKADRDGKVGFRCVWSVGRQ